MSDATERMNAEAEYFRIVDEARKADVEYIDALTALVKRLTASGQDLRTHLGKHAWPADAQVKAALDEADAAKLKARALIGEDGKDV